MDIEKYVSIFRHILQNYNDELLKEFESSNLTEFDKLKLFLPDWPVAIEEEQLCDVNNVDDKKERGLNIIESLSIDNLNGKKVLDFGCGEGFLSLAAVENQAAFVCGYDITLPNADNQIENRENLLLTNSLDEVKKHQYDIIILWDVLDHVADPVNVLNSLKEVSAPGVKLYVKCHPWCSRHGGHFYRSMNKAFINLVFSEDELQQLAVTSSEPYNEKVIAPLSTYNGLFQASGWNKIQEDIVRTPVEDFFIKNELIKKRIMQNWNRTPDQEFPRFQMEQSFLSFVLSL